MADFPVKTESSVKTYRKAASVFFLLFALPCLLSVINITFAESWKIHFFPAAVILAAVIFGPTGGVAAGVSGSLYTALFLGNPYVIVGNALFGAMTALFYKKTGKLVLAALLAYLVQLPWLILTDYYLVNLSANFITRLVVVQLLGNILWAALIQLNIRPLKKLFGYKP